MIMKCYCVTVIYVDRYLSYEHVLFVCLFSQKEVLLSKCSLKVWQLQHFKIYHYNYNGQYTMHCGWLYGSSGSTLVL